MPVPLYSMAVDRICPCDPEPKHLPTSRAPDRATLDARRAALRRARALNTDRIAFLDAGDIGHGCTACDAAIVRAHVCVLLSADDPLLDATGQDAAGALLRRYPHGAWAGDALPGELEVHGVGTLRVRPQLLGGALSLLWSLYQPPTLFLLAAGTYHRGEEVALRSLLAAHGTTAWDVMDAYVRARPLDQVSVRDAAAVAADALR